MLRYSFECWHTCESNKVMTSQLKKFVSKLNMTNGYFPFTRQFFKSYMANWKFVFRLLQSIKFAIINRLLFWHSVVCKRRQIHTCIANATDKKPDNIPIKTKSQYNFFAGKTRSENRLLFTSIASACATPISFFPGSIQIRPLCTITTSTFGDMHRNKWKLTVAN